MTELIHPQALLQVEAEEIAARLRWFAHLARSRGPDPGACPRGGYDARVWSRLLVHVDELARSSYAPLLHGKLGRLLDRWARGLTDDDLRQMLAGMNIMVAAMLADVLADPTKRGQAPAGAVAFELWWSSVIHLAGLRDPSADDDMSATPAPGFADLPLLARGRALAALLVDAGVEVGAPVDEPQLARRQQWSALRCGRPMSLSEAQAQLRTLGLCGLLRLLVPSRCAVLGQVEQPDAEGVCDSLQPYMEAWRTLAGLTAGDLQLQHLGAALDSRDSRGVAVVLWMRANGMPQRLRYERAEQRLDGRLFDHLADVVEQAQVPGCFLVDRLHPQLSPQVAYVPLSVGVALQQMGALQG